MAAQVRPCSVRVECFLLGQDQHPQALIDQEGAAARVTFRGEQMDAAFDLDSDAAHGQ